jgi:hypothetical protein
MMAFNDAAVGVTLDFGTERDVAFEAGLTAVFRDVGVFAMIILSGEILEHDQCQITWSDDES